MKSNILIGLLTLFIIGIYGVNHLTPPPMSTEETTVTIEDLKESEETLQKEKTIKVKHLDLVDANVTYLTSEVNSMSVDIVINDITKFNKKDNRPIYLLLDSPGGSVMDGSRLVSVIEGSKNRIKCIDVGLSASMAFIILEHCHTRMAVSRATLMGHPASLQVMFQGELDKIVSRLTYMKRYVDKFDKNIAKRAGMSYEKFKLLTQQELWIDSADAVSLGLLDEIVSVNLPAITDINPDSGSEKIKRLFKLE